MKSFWFWAKNWAMVTITGVVNRGIYGVTYPRMKKMLFVEDALEFKTGWMKFG